MEVPIEELRVGDRVKVRNNPNRDRGPWSIHWLATQAEFNIIVSLNLSWDGEKETRLVLDPGGSHVQPLDLSRRDAPYIFIRM